MADFMPTRTSAILGTAARAAKILFLLIGVASTAVVTARLASPHFPRLRAAALSSLAPPYLFFAVHFIIMVIWRLHQNQNQNPEEAVVTAANTNTPEIIIPERDPAEPININADGAKRRPWPPPPPPDDDDDDTDQEEIKEMIQEAEETDRSRPPPSNPDSMDATWKAIMASKSSPAQKQLAKSDTWEKPKPALARAAPVQNQEPSPTKKEMRKSKTFKESTSSGNNVNAGWRGRDVLVVSHDELFRKVESFIKMNYEQMRAKRRESEQRPRYVDRMANAAY